MPHDHDRELATISTELKEVIHKQRNARMILDLALEEQREQRVIIERLRTTIRTTLYILGIVSGVLAWLIELAMRA